MQRFENMRNNLEILVQQKRTLEQRAFISEKAIEELEKVEEDAVIYKIVGGGHGGIMVRVPKSRILPELKENKEATELKIATLEKQEARLRQQLEEMGAKIQAELKSRNMI